MKFEPMNKIRAGLAACGESCSPSPGPVSSTTLPSCGYMARGAVQVRPKSSLITWWLPPNGTDVLENALLKASSSRRARQSHTAVGWQASFRMILIGLQLLPESRLVFIAMSTPMHQANPAPRGGLMAGGAGGKLVG